MCRLLRDKDAELVDAKMQITKLTADMKASATELEKLQLSYDSNLSQMRVKQLHDKEMVHVS